MQKGKKKNYFIIIYSSVILKGETRIMSRYKVKPELVLIFLCFHTHLYTPFVFHHKLFLLPDRSVPGCHHSLLLRTELFQWHRDTNTNEPRGGSGRKTVWPEDDMKTGEHKPARKEKNDTIGEWQSLGPVYLKGLSVPHINIRESILSNGSDILFPNLLSKLSLTHTWPHIQIFLSTSIPDQVGPKLQQHHEKITGGSIYCP